MIVNYARSLQPTFGTLARVMVLVQYVEYQGKKSMLLYICIPSTHSIRAETVIIGAVEKLSLGSEYVCLRFAKKNPLGQIKEAKDKEKNLPDWSQITLELESISVKCAKVTFSMIVAYCQYVANISKNYIFFSQNITFTISILNMKLLSLFQAKSYETLKKSMRNATKLNSYGFAEQTLGSLCGGRKLDTRLFLSSITWSWRGSPMRSGKM